MERQYKIYMDVCCLNRPFDDWTQPRIQLEAEAILAITTSCQTEQWQLISSTALESEIFKTPDLIRRQRVVAALAIAQIKVSVTLEILTRAQNITLLGIQPFDALHIACAESATADIFLTTDDRLLRKVANHQSTLSVQVANPVSWLMEVSVAEEETP